MATLIVEVLLEQFLIRNVQGGGQAPSGLAIAPPRFIPKALRNGKV